MSVGSLTILAPKKRAGATGSGPFSLRSQEERGLAEPGGERRCLGPAKLGNSVIIGTFAVFREVKAFALGFLGGTQAKDLVDPEEQDRRADA